MRTPKVLPILLLIVVIITPAFAVDGNKSTSENRTAVVVKQLETDAVEPVVENEPVTETKRTGEQINWWVMAAGGEMSGMSET
ncbi:MAG: hypothetical protein GY841_14990, partial [FCB group bacterium]|nr:hypothetical protein [FCB group bacterium]